VGGVPGGTAGGTVGGVIGGIISSTPNVAPPPPPPVKKEAPPKRIRVGGAVQKARIVKQVRPVYPALARQARIQGTVKLTAEIAKDGSIQKLDVLSGHPLLIPSALQAVKQWRYKPTLLNGQAVEVLTQIDVNFTLSG
jgi:protein TonB